MVRSYSVKFSQIVSVRVVLLTCFILQTTSLHFVENITAPKKNTSLSKVTKLASSLLHETKNNALEHKHLLAKEELNENSSNEDIYKKPLEYFSTNSLSNDLIVFYDLDACNVSNNTSNQFPPTYYPSSCVNINASNFWYSQYGNTYHSCVSNAQGFLQGAESSMDAMCWMASHQNYFNPIGVDAGNHQHYYSFSFNTNTSSIARIASLSFYARGPFTTSYRTPSKLGIRVYKNGSLVYEETEVPMNRAPWQFFEFDFSSDLDFQLSNTTDTYEVRIQGYDPQGTAYTTLMEIDQIRLYASCSTVTVDPCTTTTLDSDGDGVNDICDLDDDNDGIPDVDECYFSALASSSIAPDGIQDGNYPVGY